MKTKEELKIELHKLIDSIEDDYVLNLLNEDIVPHVIQNRTKEADEGEDLTEDEIMFTKRFAGKVVKVSQYLEKEWSIKVSADFLAKIDKTILSISINPHIGSPSSKFPDIRKTGVTKHNKIYYRIKKKKVILIDFVETKMNPKKKQVRMRQKFAHKRVFPS